ncbi:MAG: pyridoxamine 5'-phosphate oxidase family protein [Pseudohongiellaceae bacterium]|nr:pyridoxamine 5'-phosphate oxidase family protein [Pseudohongiellaceae bacterium]
MAHRYAQIVFTEQVRRLQEEKGSRESYARLDAIENSNHMLSERESTFIAQRDSVYMASVGETGWPYLQHRGGPMGFMRVLAPNVLGYSDFVGNRQYVSAGNFMTNNRVALFFMDYLNRRRLKVMGRIQQVPEDDWETLAKLEIQDYKAESERGYLIKIEGFDWNCPRHISPRFSKAEVQQLFGPVMEENENLKEQLAKLQAQVSSKVLDQDKLK